MILRGLLFLTTVSNCVLSLPVTSSHLENEDVKVMKCIVEALADVLSRPHPLPVSQECMVLLRTDDRLVSILRHHNFLKELQDIAVLGERAQLQGDIIAPDHVTPVPHSADDVPDQSMLDALGGPGERSILTQKKRTMGTVNEEDGAGPLHGEESQERNEIDGKSQEKRGKDERPDNHISDPVNDWSENGSDEKREEEEEEEEDEEEKRATSVEENSKGHESSEKRDTPESKSEEKKSAEEVEEEEEKEGGGKEEEVKKKRFLHASSQEEEEEEKEEEAADREVKAEDAGGLKKWTKRARKPSGPAKKRGGGTDGAQARERGGSQQEVPHHSKEAMGGQEERTEESRRSPEVKELQMMARREEEEEDGSASRKSEEPEIESLAAIESELESVAQKLHELRRG